MDAIVYTSSTGFTERYARMLGEETGLAVLTLEDALKRLEKGADVFYLGWIMAGGIMGCKKAVKRFRVQGVCGVGMSNSQEQEAGIRKSGAIPSDVHVFILRGGLNVGKLKARHKFLMQSMINITGKQLAQKQNRTPVEDNLLEVFENGGDFVSKENLAPVLAWWEANK